MPGTGTSRARKSKALTSRARFTGSSYRQSSDFGDGAGSVNQKYLLAAGEIIAAQARVNASKFSDRIPPSTYTVPGDSDDEVIIITDGATAPNASPFELGTRHPLNFPNQIAAAQGNRRPFGRTPRRPYMSRALRSKAQEALDTYAKSLDELVDIGLTAADN